MSGSGAVREAVGGITVTLWPARSRHVLRRRYNGAVADSIEQLSYELSTQTLGEQERSVSGLRARAFATAIWVLLPHPFSFAFGGTALVGQSDHVDGVDVKDAYRAAVLWMDPSITANRDAIERLSNWFSVCCACFALEVVLWTISLARYPQSMAATPSTTPAAPKAPAQLPATPPPGFAIPEKRGGDKK